VERDSIKYHPVCCVPHATIAVEIGKSDKWESQTLASIQLHVKDGPGLTGDPFRFGANIQASAQFSSAYCAALGVLRGRIDLPEIMPVRILEDVEVYHWAQRVIMAPMCDLHTPTPVPNGAIPWIPRGGDIYAIEVCSRDGRRRRVVKTYRDILGPDVTMDWNKIVNKFTRCAAFGEVAPLRTQLIIDHVVNLEYESTIDRLLECLQE
jgi:2-methylcitrate dehydratase PrpD